MIKKITLLGIIVLFTLLFIYCTTDESTITGPFGNADKYISIANFSADKTFLYSNGDTTIVRIKVLDVEKTPVIGLIVDFSAQFGSITESDTTDSSGTALAIFVSDDNTGENIITADTGVKKYEMQLHVVHYQPKYVELFADSPLLLADGISSTKITAAFKDSVGNPMPGLLVTFSTTLGVLYPTIIKTDGDGVATTTLTSVNEEGIATITATSFVTIDIEVEFKNYVPEYVEIDSEALSLLADGISKVKIIAKLYDSADKVIPGAVFDFSTTFGSLNKTTNVRANQEGIAEVTLTSLGSSIDIDATVKAVVTVDTSVSAYINLEFRGIFSSTKIDSAKMSDDGIYEAYIKAQFFEDTNGESISSGAVYFSSPVGTMNDQLEPIDEHGTAFSVFKAEVLPTNQYDIIITSELSSAPEVSSETEEFDIPGVEILVNTIDDEIMGDGVGYALVKATLREITGKAITETRVDWETTLGTIKRQSRTSTIGHTIDTLVIENGVSQPTNVTISANYGDHVSASDILTIIPPFTDNRIILGAEPDITEGPCVTFDSLRTCVYGIDDAGRIIIGSGGGNPIYCGSDGDTWCYRICGQDIVQAGAFGTRDIAVTAIFKDENNNPLYGQTLRFWLTPADANATICEQDIVPNSLGYARVTLTYPIQSSGDLVRIWAEAPDGTQGSIDVILPVIEGE